MWPTPARRRQLSSEVEGSASVFKLHYEELMRKDREISDLQVGAGWGRQGWLGNLSCGLWCSRRCFFG